MRERERRKKDDNERIKQEKISETSGKTWK